MMSDLGQLGDSLITDEMVEKAWKAGKADLGAFNSRWDKPAIRAALRAVEGDIIEAFGASGESINA